MVMVGQAQRLAQPLAWTLAGKIAVGFVCSCLIAAVVAVVVLIASGGTREAKGCFEVTFPGVVGAQYLHACGPKARAICAEPSKRTEVTRQTLEQACRKAGYPFGDA